MKTSCAISLFTALLLSASFSAAQAPQPPKPGPEVQRLAYLAGDWKNEGTMHASAFGPGGKFTSRNHNEWFPGKFFLLSHSDSTLSGMGVVKGMAIFGYDPQNKVYTYRVYNSMGQAQSSTGTIQGADWTWTNDYTYQGKTYKNRFLLHEDSPSAYSMKVDLSDDGGNTWKTVMEGNATRTTAAALTR
jgi:hypothetical protein